MEVLWSIVTVLGVSLLLALCIVLYYYCLWRRRRLRASLLPLHIDASHSSISTRASRASFTSTCQPRASSTSTHASQASSTSTRASRASSTSTRATWASSNSTRASRASPTSKREPLASSTSTREPWASSTSTREPRVSSTSTQAPRASSTSTRAPRASSTSSYDPTITSTSTHTSWASTTAPRGPSLASISKCTPQASTTATHDPSLYSTSKRMPSSTVTPCRAVHASANSSLSSSVLPSATRESRKPNSSTCASTSQAPKVLSRSFYPSVHKRKTSRPSEWQPTIKRCTTPSSSFLPPTPPASPPIPIFTPRQEEEDSSPTNSISEQFILSPNGSPNLHFQHGDLRQTDILCRELGDPMLDLHGQTVTEAIETTEKFLGQSQGRFDTVRIVTGRGIHAEGGVPKIKPAIQKLLRRQKYMFEEENQGGCFVVSIAPHKSVPQGPSPTNSISRQFTLSPTGSPTLHFQYTHKLQSEILCREQGDPTLDLRGLTVMEAKQMTIKFLNQSKGMFDQVRIITGRGLKNGGVSKIKPAIERILNDLSYKFTEESLGGCLVVNLD